MALFTDTITIYHRTSSGWDRYVINGVQWSDHQDKEVETGRLNIVTYAKVTIPGHAIGDAQMALKEDAIFFGELTTECTDTKGNRVSDLLKTNKGGMIQSINDNTNRTYLPNIKVVIS